MYITSFGRVLKSDDTEFNYSYSNGYKHISYKGKSYRVHRLVAKAFIPNPHNYPYVDHIDGNKLNNHYTNLRWCTHQQNMDFVPKDKFKCGSEAVSITWGIQTFNSIRECAQYICAAQGRNLDTVKRELRRAIRGERSKKVYGEYVA